MKEYLRVPKSITYEKVYNRALEIFNNDRDKTNSWWIKKKEEFHDKSPYEMVKEGKGRQLMKILEKCG